VNYSFHKHGVIHPKAEVRADGWSSTIGTLHKYGWEIEFSKSYEYDGVSVYLRNPSKNMVGTCNIDGMQIHSTYGNAGPLVYMDEQILLKADLYRQIQRPKLELFSMDVGRPTRPLDAMRGEEHEWDLYTADKQETEIIVTPEKVPMLLEEIRKAQAPKAKEIIHSQHRREYQKLEAKATILAFG